MQKTQPMQADQHNSTFPALASGVGYGMNASYNRLARLLAAQETD